MIRFFFLVFILLPAPLAAQDQPDQLPQLLIDFPETETMPGQPLTLRLTVLVPTFMPKPPVWPSFEAPNLLVRLPARATNPTSQRVGGETWAGVSRRYEIAPMVPGNVVLPAQEVVVTYRNPETGDSEQVRLMTGSIAFRAVVPEGAEGLDPFIAAADLKLSQEIEGNPAAMVAGDSTIRRIRVEVTGASPMFLPSLMPPADLTGLAAYPDEPRLTEAEDRGVTSGSRTESITYVAEGGGGGTAPAIELGWYDIDDGLVKTASADAVDFHVEGPPAQTSEPRDWTHIGAVALVALAGLGLLVVLVRRIAPRVRQHREELIARRLASERHAWQEMMRTVARRDESAFRRALEVWAQRVETHDPRNAPELQSALTALGAARFGRLAGNTDSAWKSIDTALRRSRQARHPDALRAHLPPLNPS